MTRSTLRREGCNKGGGGIGGGDSGEAQPEIRSGRSRKTPPHKRRERIGPIGVVFPFLESAGRESQGLDDIDLKGMVDSVGREGSFVTDCRAFIFGDSL